MAAILRADFVRQGFATPEQNFFSPGSNMAFYTRK
jgi:hypothetical protein